jgi:hypothetical protein
MGVFRRVRKHIAISRYLDPLGPLLVKRYGASEWYSHARIHRTIVEHRLSLRYLHYAFAMYGDRASFIRWMEQPRRVAPPVDLSRWVADHPYRARRSVPAGGETVEARALLAQAYGDAYERLRAEVATEHNGGRRQFLPRISEDIGMDNGDNVAAAARWGIGL